MAAVDDLGREQREDPVPVPVLDIGAVLALQFLGLPFPDPLVLQLGRDLGKGGVPVADQRTHRFIDGFQLLLGSEQIPEQPDEYEVPSQCGQGD